MKQRNAHFKINKTGRRLSEWETKLVENRSSSFARVVMSLANINDAAHCWPARDDENPHNDSVLKTKTNAVIARIEELNRLLFEPPFKTPIASAQQPLFAIPLSRPDLRPAYAAELLTITSGKKGRKAETEALISFDRKATATNIVNNASRLLDDGFSVLHHVYGQSPRSMTLMPLVYFYNPQGAYVRSLLYGMLFWLANGSETTEIADRKLLFTLHRKAFEDVLLKHKDTIISRIARRIGSGPEVTYQTARYFNELLHLLIEHSDQIETKEFEAQHEKLIETLQRPDASKNSISRASTSRTFRGVERQKVQTSSFLKMFQGCEICGGRFYPGLYTEVDHIVQHAKSGPTQASNGREVHPFCNNNRDKIEALKNGSKTLALPSFDDPTLLPKSQQLSLLSLMEEHQDDLDDDEEELIDEDEVQYPTQLNEPIDSNSESESELFDEEED